MTDSNDPSAALASPLSAAAGEATVPHMTPDEFRRHGREVVEWIARYMERVEELPVLSQVAPGAIRAQLPAHPPEDGEGFAAMLADVDRVVMPGITHWQSPSFFAYFPSNVSGPAILADMLSTGLGVQGMLWSTSPACTEVETLMLDWLAEALGLPAAFRSDGAGGGVIQDSASSATLCALLAARERASGGAANARGTDGRYTVYASQHAHSSIDKGLMVAGMGRDNLRSIPADAAHAMRPQALAEAIAADRAAGKVPACVIASVGTTSSLAIDPVRAIGEICKREGVWLHVDAAMAGTAALCPEYRWIHDGLELADSYTVNPHKWMLTAFDLNALYVADRRPLLQALSILPEYLKNAQTDAGAVIDYRDWQVPLGRRFRALKLWFVFRWYGLAGLRAMVRHHVLLAQQFAGWVDQEPNWEVVAPAPLCTVCFRHIAGDEVNQRAMDGANKSGELFLSRTRLDGKLTLRMVTAQAQTELRHVERAWEVLRAAAVG